MTWVNDNLIERVYDYDVILNGMGINNSFREGFSYDIKLNFPEVRAEENRLSPYGDLRKLGTILPIKYDNIVFCMCYMNTGGYSKRYKGKCFMDYDALDRCLKEVKDNFKNKKIASPIIGSTRFDGDGDRDKIIEIFEKHFSGNSNFFIHDYEQKDFNAEVYYKIAEIRQEFGDKKINKEEYHEKRRQLDWISKYGIFKKMPDDYKRLKQGEKYDKQMFYVTKEIKEKFEEK